MLNSVFNFLINKSALALTLLLVLIGCATVRKSHTSLLTLHQILSRLKATTTLLFIRENAEKLSRTSSSSLIISYTTEDGVLDPQQIKYLRALRDDLLALEEG